MYLLDTGTVIYSMKGHEGIRKNLRSHLHDTLKVSVITLMEFTMALINHKESPATSLN